MGWLSLLYWLTVWVHRFFEFDGCHGHPKWQKMKETSCFWESKSLLLATLLGTNIRSRGTFEDHFPISQGGKKSSLEGKSILSYFLGVSFQLIGHLPEVSNWKSSKSISQMGSWKIHENPMFGRVNPRLGKQQPHPLTIKEWLLMPARSVFQNWVHILKNDMFLLWFTLKSPETKNNSTSDMESKVFSEHTPQKSWTPTHIAESCAKIYPFGSPYHSPRKSIPRSNATSKETYPSEISGRNFDTLTIQ